MLADRLNWMQHEATTSTKDARRGYVSPRVRQLGPGLLESVYRSRSPTRVCRLSERWMGLLLSFNTDRIENGLRRMLNG
jgi:hypothetical protein